MSHIQDLWFSPGPDGKDRPTVRHGSGKRWKARYLGPGEKERSRTFARKSDAERFLTEIEHSKIAGSYLDPDAGRVTIASRVPVWLSALTCDDTTRHLIEGRVEKHLVPALGDRRLDTLVRSPSLIQAWVARLPVGPAYAAQILGDLSGILEQAVTDNLIPRNPCRSARIRAPRAPKRKLVPWTSSQVASVRAGLPDRYRAMVDAGAGLGLRQGEIFGLATDEIDWLRRRVRVTHQIRLHLGSAPVFAAPKGGRDRVVPLPAQVSAALAAHIAEFPPIAVTLPHGSADGAHETRDLLFTTPHLGHPLHRGAFSREVWVPARRAAGISDGRENGMHALRHHYASTLLRGGVDVKRVQEWLGHHSAAFTLDIYGHLLADDEDASLRQVEAILGAAMNTLVSHETGT